MSPYSKISWFRFLRSSCEINSRNLYIYFLVGSVPAILVERSSTANIASILLWLFIKGCGLFTAYAFWSSAAWFSKGRYQTKIYDLIFIGALGAGLGGFTVHHLGNLFAIEDEVRLAQRIFTAALLGAVWLPSISTANNSLTKFRSSVKEMTDRLVSQDQIKFKQSMIFEFLTSSFYRSIQQKLSVTSLEARELFNSYLSNPATARELPEIVTKIATTSFRDLSHSIHEEFKLKQQEGGAPESPKMWNRLRKSIHVSAILRRTPILDPFPYALITSLFCAAFILRHSNSITSAVTILIIFCSNFFTLKLYGFLCTVSKFPKGIFIFLAITSTAILPPVLFSFLRLVKAFDYRFDGTHFYALSYFVLAMVISFLGYVAVLIRTTIKEIEIALHNQYQIGADKEEIVANEISRITSICAKYIHGNLQSSLITLSKNLEVAMEEKDAPKVDLLISQILEILRNPEVDLERKANNIHLEIRSKAALWDGLVEIHQNVSIAESRIPSLLVIQISDCVEEAISNAVRHGKASAIGISLDEGSDGKLILKVTDNGLLTPNPIGGLGFRIYQEASNGNWSIKRDEVNNLTVIEVTFYL